MHIGDKGSGKHNPPAHTACMRDLITMMKGKGLLQAPKKAGKVAKVMHEYKAGTLHSGSKHGPMVTSRKQAIAIGLSEARKASR